jgi:release factor glutamine methyltransferase
MTIADAWMAGREHLIALGTDEAGLTAEVLLRHTLGFTRTELYMAWDRPIDETACARYQGFLDERASGRPVAYITGHREFMGLDFRVDERVLIPRPETEVLVEFVLELVRDIAAPAVADIGTGSGAIAISLAVARRDASIIATDLSAAALDVARENAARHAVAGAIRFLQGDLLEPVVAAGVPLDVVACNPPYVAPHAADGLPKDIRDFEPALAVVAPGAGETLHARLVEDAPRALKPGGWLVMEVAAGQAPRVVEILDHSGVFAVPQCRRDGLGWERVLAARVRTASATED